jgi:hypothetical protein
MPRLPLPHLYSGLQNPTNPLRQSQFSVDFINYPLLNRYVQGFSKSKNKTVIKFTLEEDPTMQSHLGFKSGIIIFDIINQENIFNISFSLFNTISEKIMEESDSFTIDDYFYFMDYSSSSPSILEISFIKQ